MQKVVKGAMTSSKSMANITFLGCEFARFARPQGSALGFSLLAFRKLLVAAPHDFSRDL